MPKGTKGSPHRFRCCAHCGKSFEGIVVNLARRRFCGLACHYAERRARFDDVAGRFWSKVDKRGENECWGWKAQKRWDGYGRFVTNMRPMWAHRVSYELHHGPIPAGMHVLHSCDTPECTNPKHLSLGTHQQNMAEMSARRRAACGERNRRNKLNEGQAKAILAKKPAGRTSGLAKQLADEHGVVTGAIYAIWRGDAWKHLQERT